MTKLSILAKSNDSRKPFGHLEVIIQALLSSGNKLVYNDAFHLDPDGWRCLLENPIDFGLLESKFEFPENIQLSRDHDSILDTNTWVEIRGGFKTRQAW